MRVTAATHPDLDNTVRCLAAAFEQDPITASGQQAYGACICRTRQADAPDPRDSTMPAFDQLTLHTTRLLLRPLRRSDADALLAIFSDRNTMRYWSTTPWESIEQAHAMIDRDLQTMATGEHLRFGLERTQDRTLIGTCTLFDISAQCRRAELGYIMASHAWGQAYMGEALRALLNYGFTELKLNRIEADIDPRNQASARSLERLGFKQEGYLRERWVVGGEVSDTALYGLLHRDWRWRA